VGKALGIAAQVLLVAVIIGHVMPFLGLKLLGMARGVAALNLPARGGRSSGSAGSPTQRTEKALRVAHARIPGAHSRSQPPKSRGHYPAPLAAPDAGTSDERPLSGLSIKIPIERYYLEVNRSHEPAKECISPVAAFLEALTIQSRR
jgi:hypothetical protein